MLSPVDVKSMANRRVHVPSISLFIVLVMVHVSAPYSKILSTVERKKFIFNLRGKSDLHMLSNI